MRGRKCFYRRRPRAVSEYSVWRRQAVRMDLPRLLLDGQSLSSTDRDAQGQSLDRHAPAQRDLYREF